MMYRTSRMGTRSAGWLAVAAWSLLPAVALGQGPSSENVLIILADDLGVDVLDSYDEGSTFPPTPNISALRDAGVLFRNAYSNPLCSPTRATIQTGRHSFRTGVGWVVGAGSLEGLAFSETIIPDVLGLVPSLGYGHAAIGKWHLNGDSEGGADAPNLSGYAHFAGTRRNVTDYYSWTKDVNGEEFNTRVYATTDNVDEAVAWINDQGQEPWFMWLAFNAPHAPFQAPPKDLHSFDLPPNPSAHELYQAMVEAMDTEMGRLFESMEPDVFDRTNIIFLGDNGTPKDVTMPPFDPNHAKGTLYEGGINVPLIISGPRVVSPGRESAVLVNTTDLFATALEMMGVDPATTLPADVVLDSISILPVIQDQSFDARVNVYAEQFNTDPTFGGQTILDHQFKLIRLTAGTEEFYDLVADLFETTDLLQGKLDPIQQAAFDELSEALDLLTLSVCEGDANGDGSVDPLDSGFVLARFGCQVGTGDPDCDTADQNGDGEVNPLDTGFVLARFGDCR